MSLTSSSLKTETVRDEPAFDTTRLKRSIFYNPYRFRMLATLMSELGNESVDVFTDSTGRKFDFGLVRLDFC